MNPDTATRCYDGQMLKERHPDMSAPFPKVTTRARTTNYKFPHKAIWFQEFDAGKRAQRRRCNEHTVAAAGDSRRRRSRAAIRRRHSLRRFLGRKFTSAHPAVPPVLPRNLRRVLVHCAHLPLTTPVPPSLRRIRTTGGYPGRDRNRVRAATDSEAGGRAVAARGGGRRGRDCA